MRRGPFTEMGKAGGGAEHLEGGGQDVADIRGWRCLLGVQVETYKPFG